MVIPLPANESINALPDEGRPLLVVIKWCVIGLWIFSFVLALFAPLSVLSSLGLAFFGTYLLAEDPQMSTCYQRIRETALGQCCGTGGLRMLMPFFLLGAINSFVDGLALIQMFSTYGWKTFSFIPVDVLLCIFLCEFTSSLASWRIIKMVLPVSQFENGYQEQPGAPGSLARPLGGPGPGGVSNPSVSVRAADFKPFQGTGHKLGG